MEKESPHMTYSKLLKTHENQFELFGPLGVNRHLLTNYRCVSNCNNSFPACVLSQCTKENQNSLGVDS